MGTRNLTKVIDKNGEVVVGQYGQWDGYPDGQGKSMLAFISEYKMLDKIELSLAKCRFIPQEVVENADFNYQAVSKWEEIRKTPNGFGIVFPSLSRDTCTDILKVIVYSNEDVILYDDSEFENDDLMCEGVYTLNYQTKQFISTYHNITASFDFDKLPTLEEYLKPFAIDNPNDTL